MRAAEAGYVAFPSITDSDYAPYRTSAKEANGLPNDLQLRVQFRLILVARRHRIPIYQDTILAWTEESVFEENTSLEDDIMSSEGSIHSYFISNYVTVNPGYWLGKIW